MKILEVVESCSAGVGRHVRGLCEGLIAQGHQVTVAHAPYRLDEAFRQFMLDHRNEIEFVPLKLRREITPGSDLVSLVQLVNLVRRDGPFDIIHGHSSKGGALARLAGRWSRVPTVYTPNGLIMASPEVPRTKRLAYTLIERILGNWMTSKMIAVSEEERELILRLRLIPNNRIALVNNGVDDATFAHFSESRVRQEAISANPLTFGSMMRFSVQKAPDHLIEAFARLVRMMPQTSVRLVVAGDGELLAKVKEQVQASEQREKISLLGWKTDVSEVLRKCDVFVISSLYEGFSYAILEAMAARLPIVSTDVFGTKETIARVPGNVLVPAGDPDALAHGMKQMVNLILGGSSREALEEIGRANHDCVRSHFTQRETTLRTLKIYQELL